MTASAPGRPEQRKRVSRNKQQQWLARFTSNFLRRKPRTARLRSQRSGSEFGATAHTRRRARGLQLLYRACAPMRPVRLAICRIERSRARFGQFQEFRGKPYHSIRVALLDLMTIGALDLIRAGMGWDFKNAPPLILVGMPRDPLIL